MTTTRNWSRTGLTSATLVAIALMIGTPRTVLSQATPPVPEQSNAATLLAKGRLFANYSKDFRAFAKAQKSDTVEQRVTINLMDASQQTEGWLASASTILLMYESVVCKEDRVRLLPHVKRALQYYSQTTENEIDETNNNLSYVKSTATAQLGLRMKDDLRETKETVNTMDKSLQ